LTRQERAEQAEHRAEQEKQQRHQAEQRAEQEKRQRLQAEQRAAALEGELARLRTEAEQRKKKK
jgi:hypothetical protein